MPERRLAAIMFTDIVGYTALMGSDEDRAFEVIKKSREIHTGLIKQFSGNLIKEMGDGMLISFNLASDAVRCAIEIQKACNQQDIPLKIGIHEGEMVFEGTDVLGDGVNIASRLQEDAPEGCISISGSVYRDIKNKAGIKVKFIAEKSFKNVDEPIKIYNVACEYEAINEEKKPIKEKTRKSNKKYLYYILTGIVIVIATILIWFNLSNDQTSLPLSETTEKELDKSIAVLPFKNLSNNPNDKHLADGVRKAILTHLQRIGDLILRSNTSTESYRSSQKDVRQIGKELEANYILEGSFQKVGDQANLIVQLIESNTDKLLWAEEYNRDWSDIFTIQKEVAKMVADKLNASLSKEAKVGMELIPTKNMVAYDLYLKGLEQYPNFLIDFDIDKVYNSIELFHKSIELDNNFSLGYAGLGRAYWMLAELKNPSSELWINSREYLMKAIELDPYNGSAYAELGVVQSNYDWDSTAARKSFEIAIKFTPTNLYVYEQYYYYVWTTGNCEKVNWLKNVISRLDPDIVSDSIDLFNLMLWQCQGNNELIAEVADKYWSEDNYPLISMPIFNAYLATKQYEKAEAIVKNFKKKLQHKSTYYSLNAILNALNGNKNEALVMLNNLDQISNTELVTRTQIAGIYASLGNKEKMYKFLEEALDQRDYHIHLVSYWPEFYPFIHEPRFKEIIKRSWIARKAVN